MGGGGGVTRTRRMEVLTLTIDLRLTPANQLNTFTCKGEKSDIAKKEMQVLKPFGVRIADQLFQGPYQNQQAKLFWTVAMPEFLIGFKHHRLWPWSYCLLRISFSRGFLSFKTMARQFDKRKLGLLAIDCSWNSTLAPWKIIIIITACSVTSDVLPTALTPSNWV